MVSLLEMDLPSKPHLRFVNHVWSCISWRPYTAGYGYTVRDAFNEWKAERVKHG